MSSVAAWANTSTATVWPLLGRDQWSGLPSYGPPESFACTYSAESRRMTDARGIEFTSRQIVHTERATLKQGDMLLIGRSAATDPVAAGAHEVRSVLRHADVFEGKADDFQIVT